METIPGPDDGLLRLNHGTNVFPQLVIDGAHALPVPHLILSLRTNWHAAESGRCRRYPVPELPPVPGDVELLPRCANHLSIFLHDGIDMLEHPLGR